MQYETFKHLIAKELHAHFQGSHQITFQKVTKNNGRVLDGLIILENGLNIAPTIYLDYYYTKYEQGSSFSDVLKELIQDYEDSRPAESVSVSFFTDINLVQHHIIYRVVNYEKNLSLLKDIPYLPYLDLAIIFYCLIPIERFSNATILIHNQHMEHWQITVDDLFAMAKKNTPLLLNYECKSMESILFEETDLPGSTLDHIYVLTNKQRLYGACCILYPNLLQQIADRIHSDFYILPSSIHEVILLPAKNCQELSEMSAMVNDVNTSEVLPEEILSDKAYYYSRETDCISM